MRHIKRNIVLIVGLVTLAFCTTVVFAAFIFSRIIDGSASTGNVYRIEKKILNYSYYADKSSEYMSNLASTSDGRTTILSNLDSRASDPVEIDNDTITCYATRRTGFVDEWNEYHLPNLNQLGFSISFTTTIDAYLRIHFEDAWIVKKTYNSGKTEESYIVKDQLNGIYEQVPSIDVNAENFAAYYVLTPKASTSASTFSTTATYFTLEINEGIEYYKFAAITEEEFNTDKGTGKYYTITSTRTNSYNENAKYFKFTAESPFKIAGEDWYYDAGRNIAYYKTKIDVDESQKEKQNFDFDFPINSTYFYKEHIGSFHEAVKVKLSYYVDVVQANRVQAIWNLQPEKLV